MKKRLHHAHWWQLALPVVAIAAIAYVAITESPSAGIFAALAVVAAVFTVWNPFEALPHPKLALEQDDGTESDHVRLEGPRPVDIDAIVKNAGAEARAGKPLEPLLPMQGYLKPTNSDYEKYEEEVEQYEQKVRRWAEKAQDWLGEQALTLEARVVMRNPSSVDAHDAGVFLIFPPGAEEASDPPETPEPPIRPAFPLRKSSLGRALDPSGGMRAWTDPPIPQVGFAYSQPEEVASIWDPNYERLANGSMRISYLRQTIHHGEREVAGRPFRARIPSGEHQINWEVHAANLPRHSSGHWKVIALDDPREPITSLVELEDALGLSEVEEHEDLETRN